MVNRIHTKCAGTVFIFIVCLILCSSCSEKINLETMLEQMTDRQNLTYFPQKEYSHKQFSSYNRASKSPDEDGWFANVDLSHFLRVEENSGRREFIMFDADGPGAIVRWWMTFYKAQYGTIRIYLDYDTIPVIEGSPAELLSGNLLVAYPFSASVQKGAPIGEEGRDYDHNFYFPVPFSKHCKISYECDSIITLYDYEGISVPEGYFWPDVFYNIGYNQFAEDVQVESFSLSALEKARPFLDSASEALLNNNVSSGLEKKFDERILPGDSVMIEFDQHLSAINNLMVSLEASNINQALRSTVMSIAFDGQQTVWVPVGEFFGSGYSVANHKTWMNQMNEEGHMESKWVMPFRENCKISFINYGSEEIILNGMACIDEYHWKPESMYFGASWHEYHMLQSRDVNNEPFDLNIIGIEGKGVYVGDQVTLFNNTYMWWGEGDEKIFVDGEAFPSSFGTGTEDYYGYSFARQEAFSHPFVSQPVGTGNMASGVTINMRHRSLDAIPFSTSILANMELWHWASVRMNYALTSYYYVLPPFKINVVPDVESVKRPVAITKSDFQLLEKNIKNEEK